jgi:hypothetical protein
LSAGARLLNERLVMGAASSDANGEDGRILLKNSDVAAQPPR